ncbi:hypothetical protein B5M09_010305 [Aphanomyces astaci]|uniref:RING-type domain-containing protein n=1 Tax=Aphanomyces astaci TaxID=112090 RepID=A0A425CPQ4_APHAT|nr:hypothetical protein B5M09_010305 [Aphanomyces astaci]
MNADDFICAVCLEPFASPITLYCGHTFDRECLVNLVGKPCPMCRQGEIRPDVVVQPKNQVMYRLGLSTCANSSDVIASRGIGHEHARLTRLATYSLSIAYHVSNLAQTGMKQSALAVADRGFDAALEAPVVKLDAYDLVTRHHGRHLDLPAGGEGSTAGLGTRVRGRVEF